MTARRRLARATAATLIALAAGAAAARDAAPAGPPAPAAPAAAERERLEAARLSAAAATRWIAPSGQANDSARDALALLAGAAADGLEPGDYASASLAARAAGLAGASPEARRAWDAELSAAVLRYLRDLHFGRVDPKALGFRVSPRRADEHDLAALLAAAIADQRVAQLAADLSPPIAPYRALRDALAHYRGLARAATGPSFAAPTTAVRAGGPYAGADALRTHLVLLGDLASSAPRAGTGLYDHALAEGVARFQSRHGLTADGVLGKATIAALNVPLAQRVQQLELALERLRWLPHPDGRRIIAINIPMFRLWAWDAAAQDGKPALAIDVIVGRALKTETPVFADEMRYLVFRPYWNVPRSIARKEVLPAIARDPDYLAKHDMEIVRGAGDDAQVLASTPQSVALLGDGAARVRQRPGASNSLGLVKFIFPNDANVYLHGTPAQSLFERSRRDFSHGCVRVADTVALAAWLLADQPRWTRERIAAAMEGGASQQVNLAQPVPVLLYYVTALVSPEDGRLRFADDIYAHDARLARALAASRRR